VHTSYYLCPPLQALISHHVLDHSAGEAVIDDGLLHESLRGWYLDGKRQALARTMGDAAAVVMPKNGNLQILVGTMLTGFALLLWLASSSLYRFSVAPLTAEYQVQQILTTSADIVPSVYGSQGLEWITALVMLGKTDLASQDALLFNGSSASWKAQVLATESATLRSMGRIGEAQAVEAKNLRMTRQITDSLERGDSAVMLERELGNYGVLRQDLLGTDLLGFSRFSREDELISVAEALNKGGRPDLAAKIFSNYATANPSIRVTATYLTMLELSGQKDRAYEVAQALDPGLNIFIGPLVMHAYAAVGEWDQAESLAASIKSASRIDVRSPCFAALARLRLQAGDTAKALADARAVTNWGDSAQDGSTVAAGLAKAGFKSEARLIALKVINDEQLYDNPWASAKELILNQANLRAAGAGTEVDAAESRVFSESVQKYKDTDADEETLGRAVYTLIEIGDLRKAEAYVRLFTNPKARADYLPVVSAAYSDAGEIADAETTLQSSIHDLAAVPGTDRRSSGYMAIAKAESHLHHYRLARLSAERCDSMRDLLNAYAAIIEEYSIEVNPRRRVQLDDARARRP
jgi:hypothetical protein